jgi:hypothetical protein
MGMKRVMVKQCTACQTLLSRDVSAACVILDIFEFQRQERTLALPFTQQKPFRRMRLPGFRKYQGTFKHSVRFIFTTMYDVL